MLTTTLNEFDLLDDKTTPCAAIGGGIDEGRLQFLLSPKRKLAETGDGGSEQPPTEKRNRGDETKEQEKQGGVCECKGGEDEMEEWEGEGESEMDEYVKEYFKRISAIHGREIRPGNMGCGGGAVDDDSDDEGHLSEMFDDPKIAKIWGGTDPVTCCPYPFDALDFKHNTELYKGLKVFGGNAVGYLNDIYNYGEAHFQDIEEVKSCSGSCKHCFVTLKAKDGSDRVWEIVLRGLLPPEGFAEANPSQFRLLQYCYG